MIYSIWAREFTMLPEKVKYEMWDYLQKHGVDPTRARGFTFDPNGPGIWVEYVVVNSLNLAYSDDMRNTGGVQEPHVISEWIWLEDCKPGRPSWPTFLEWMTPGQNPPKGLGEAGKNPSKPFVMLTDKEWGAGDGRN